MNAETPAPALVTPDGVPDSYVHFDKLIAPGEPLVTGCALLKWYEIAPQDEPVSRETQRLARDFLSREMASGAFAPDGGLGFVILHRCGRGFHFLLPSLWRNGNELWETVYAKHGPESPDFALFPLPGPTRATFCVWELRAVWHEQQAWRRYLMSARDGAARQAWLADGYAGPC